MPNLIATVDTLDAVPEAARTFYVQRDGKFHLQLEGAPAGFVPAADLATANGKVVEFRDNNILLKKQVDELLPLKTQFEGLDPVAAKAALARVVELEKKGFKPGDDITELMKQAVETAVNPLRESIKAAQADTLAERKRADDSVLRSRIGEEFIKAGGKGKALDYIVERAREVFTVDGGVLKALPSKFSAANPANPLGVPEWLATAAQEHDFAFEPSGGGNAGGSGRATGSATAARPGQTVLKNPTAAQLGEHSADIAKGKVRVEYTT